MWGPTVAIDSLEMFFLPPLAIARLGGSDTPLESFHWVAACSAYTAHQTIIQPAVTIVLDDDGTPLPYMPQGIRFRDGSKLRPVAPFFELWMRVKEGRRKPVVRPVTLELLRLLRLKPADLRFRITVANKKAQRRTQSTSCGFVAQIDCRGDDYSRKQLLAYSPTDPTHAPLVFQHAPVPLGFFQVVRPIAKASLGVDLSVIRVRFTPGKGEVYGPPTAIAAMASPLPEGENLAWSKVMQGRMHEIVKVENRILNPASLWSKYVGLAPGQTDPQPYDSYDGAKCGDQTSWGVVDDTCDGIIEGHLVVGAARLSAYARVTASVPDFAPDRRTFVSVADDLADRDLSGPAPPNGRTIALAEEEIADLLGRVFETATQINLDAERYKFVSRQRAVRVPPLTDLQSMTSLDTGYANNAVTEINNRYAIDDAATPREELQYTDMAKAAHGKLTDLYTLLDFLRTEADRVKRLIRPPFGRFEQLSGNPGMAPNPLFRDPRVDRDILHDMRMPPYMRDSDDSPLSLTWRQYAALMQLVDWLKTQRPRMRRPATSRIERRVAGVLAGIIHAADEVKQ
jgi:hypothetical protein